MRTGARWLLFDAYEYPWADGEAVVVPCQYEYPNLSLLKDHGGRNLLKLIAMALDEFESIKTT